jgi:hypothetical protein
MSEDLKAFIEAIEFGLDKLNMYQLRNLCKLLFELLWRLMKKSGD